MNQVIPLLGAPVRVIEPVPIAGCANERISIERRDDGSVKIIDANGHVVIPAADVAALRDALAEIDSAPGLVYRIDDTRPHPVTEMVSIAIGNDGEVVVVAGLDPYPCDAVTLEIPDIGAVVGALG